MLPQPANDVIDDLRRRPEDVDAGVAGIVTLFANFDFADGEPPAVGEDFIQHLGQDQGVNNMTAQFNLLGKHEKNWDNGAMECCSNAKLNWLRAQHSSIASRQWPRGNLT